MCLVKELLRKNILKPIPVVSPDTSVFSCLKELARLDVGALLVMEKDHILGVFSEKDYARKILLEGKQSDSTLVGEVMCKKVFCVSPSATLEQCLTVMIEKGVKHLPVVDDDQLLDFISMKDVIEFLVEEKEFIIGQLTQYITGDLQHLKVAKMPTVPQEVDPSIRLLLYRHMSL